jgi:hypothetical protein
MSRYSTIAIYQYCIQHCVKYFSFKTGNPKILSHVRVIIDGVWMVVGFIEHLQIVTTSKYSAIANLHTVQLTTARTKSSQSAVFSAVVAWWHISTMSSASILTFEPAGDFPKLTDFSNCPVYYSSALTAKKTPFLCCCFQLLLCKQSRYSVTAVIFLLISWSLPSYWPTRHNIKDLTSYILCILDYFSQSFKLHKIVLHICHKRGTDCSLLLVIFSSVFTYEWKFLVVVVPLIN